MAKLRIVAPGPKTRLRNTASHPAVTDEQFRAAFPGAQPIGLVPGDRHDPVSLSQLSQMLDRMLRSTGGRPGLAEADQTPLRVSLLSTDREKIEAIRTRIAETARRRPSTSQMVAVLCHFALARISEAELSAEVEHLSEAG